MLSSSSNPVPLYYTREGILSPDGLIPNLQNHSGYGSDGRYHAANAFLLGFAPFRVKKFWSAAHLVFIWIQYAEDRELFGPGGEDVWQTSRRTYRVSRGDCEDRAILLADWLLESGFDARVVIGEFQGEGHAWVALFEKNQAYLLETRVDRKVPFYPLAKLMTDYQPRIMFNRDTLWINQGPALTTEYSGKHWVPFWKFLEIVPSPSQFF